jgi:hypothetical protein
VSPGIVDNLSDGSKYVFLHYIVPIEHQAYITKNFLSQLQNCYKKQTVTMPLSAVGSDLISFFKHLILRSWAFQSLIIECWSELQIVQTLQICVSFKRSNWLIV